MLSRTSRIKELAESPCSSMSWTGPWPCGTSSFTERIRALGPQTVIIKRGENGALLFDSEGIFAAPAFPLETVVDPTGAGDSFAGGFMGAIARADATDAETLRRAVISGSTMASFCVEDFSLDRFRELSHDEIDERFEAFRHLTRF